MGIARDEGIQSTFGFVVRAASRTFGKTACEVIEGGDDGVCGHMGESEGSNPRSVDDQTTARQGEGED